MSKTKKQPAKRPATNGAPKNGKAAKAKAPDVKPIAHPGMKGEQTSIALTLTPADPEIERIARDYDAAKKQCGAWGRSVSVLKEQLRVKMTAKKLPHYYNNGVEVRGKPKDDTPDYGVTIHDPQPAPTASAKA